MKKKIIGIVVCMLLIGTVLPVSGTVMVEKVSNPASFGDTLYVGGSGPGNYTSIQKAINDAVSGDTVFVYDDSSPYYTSARVRKSINLIGENKHTTVIRSIIDFVVNISAHNVLIKGFTIEAGSKGIIVNSNYNTITDNIFTTYKGICIINSNFNIIQGNEIKSGTYAIWLDNSNDNIVTKNNISGGKAGIRTIHEGERNTISQNRISDSEKGIWCDRMNYNIVSDNYLLNNNEGIYLSSCYKTNITNNVIAASTYRGFVSIHCMYNNIYRNTFIDNEENAYFSLNFINLWPLIQRRLNKWENNYWGEAHKGPYKIYGTVYCREYFFFNFPLLRTKIEFNFTWINFDWFPAQEPYDIGI